MTEELLPVGAPRLVRCSSSVAAEELSNVVDFRSERNFPCDACGKTITASYTRWEPENMRVCDKCADAALDRATRIKSLPLIEFRKLVVNGSNELIDMLRGEPARIKVVKEANNDGSV